MHIEAFYDQGRIELTQPLHLRHPRVRVWVEVPDEEVVSLHEVDSEQRQAPTPAAREFTDKAPGDILTEIRHILGPFYRQRPAASVAADKQALMDSLAEKHGS